MSRAQVLTNAMRTGCLFLIPALVTLALCGCNTVGKQAKPTMPGATIATLSPLVRPVVTITTVMSPTPSSPFIPLAVPPAGKYLFVEPRVDVWGHGILPHGMVDFPLRTTSEAVTACISCPAANVCYVAKGETILFTGDGSKTWDSVTPGDDTLRHTSFISCPSADTCLVVKTRGYFVPNEQGYLLVTTDGGVSWSNYGMGRGANPLDIGCASNNACVAAS